MPWDVVGQPKPSILRPGSDDTTLEIIALCVGSILLTESIFLLIVIQGSAIQVAIRRLLCHHAFVLILASFSLLRRTFVFFTSTSSSSATECGFAKISNAVTECLLIWDILLMALFALAQQDPTAILYNVIVNGYLHFLLIAIAYVITSVLLGVMVGVVDGIGTECTHLRPKTLLAMDVFQVLCQLVVVILMITYVTRAKRCQRLMGMEQGAHYVARSDDNTRLANTLIIVCGVSVVLTLPEIIFEVGKVHTRHVTWDDWYAVTVAVCLLSYSNDILFLLILFFRHESLRALCRRVICHKCFVYEEDQFTHQLHSHYDVVSICHHKLQDQEVAAELVRTHASRSIASMPGLMMTQPRPAVQSSHRQLPGLARVPSISSV